MTKLSQSFLRRVAPKDMRLIQKRGNKLQDRFLMLWKQIKGPKLIQEHKFHPTRKFRLDFAHLETKTSVEINGGTWSRGNSGHSSGTGINRDAEKSNLAQGLGWTYLTLTSDMVTLEWATFCMTVIQKRGK